MEITLYKIGVLNNDFITIIVILSLEMETLSLARTQFIITKLKINKTNLVINKDEFEPRKAFPFQVKELQ